MTKKISTFRILEILVFVLLVGIIAYQQYDDAARTAMRERDVVRISDLNQVRTALEEYKDEQGAFPPCLYKKEGCTSLEGSAWMPVVPRDPLTNKAFSYAAFGPGATCNAFHVGTSLERTASQALLVGADAPPQPDSALCRGSASDFAGLSYAKGGEPCDLSVGTAQPTDSSDGETCFDLKNR
ncbi:MAG TPA: hypothetical protein VHL10_02880, partial [Nitrososphaera sp.]|nr:hypothetical protein [Nitrososphaera sp.]